MPSSTFTASFEEVARALDLYAGFVLQPLVCARAEIAAEFVEFLRHRGDDVHLFAPEGEAWVHLADDLVECARKARSHRRALVVFGPADAQLIREGVSLVNYTRDVLARELTGPLYWCGPESFLLASWRAMPDTWSIRATQMRLEARGVSISADPSDVRRALWFCEGAGDDPAQLRSLLAHAYGGLPLVRRLVVALATRADADAERTLTRHLDTTSPGGAGVAELLVVGARLALLRGDVPLAAQRAFDEALAAERLDPSMFETSLTMLPPHWRDAWCALAISLGQRALARRWLEAEPDDGPDELPGVRFERGLLALTEGDASTAETIWRSLYSRLQADPKRFAAASTQLLRLLASLQRQTGREREASETEHLARLVDADRLKGSSLAAGAHDAPTTIKLPDTRLTRAARVLASLYPDEFAVQRLLLTARVELARIDWSSPVEPQWAALLRGLEERGRLGDLISVARAEFPSQTFGI